MELTREEIENYATIDGERVYTGAVLKYIAKQLLAEMDKPRIQSAWIDAPDWASLAWIQWRNESGTHMEWREKPYTRELPKSPERLIAERRSKVIVSTQMTERELIADQIESAIGLYSFS